MPWTNWKEFNFRQTLGYISTDGANAYVVAPGSGAKGPSHPTSVTIDGDTFNVGYTAGAGLDGARNRSTGVDARLAGCHFEANSSATRARFRIDLPAAGTYEIRLAIGDQLGSTNAYWRVLDNTTALETNDFTGSGGVAWRDATGAARSAASDWVTNSAAKEFTFSSTICQIEWGGGNSSASTSGNSALAHIAIRQVSAGGGGPADPLIVWSSHRRVFVNDIITQQ